MLEEVMVDGRGFGQNMIDGCLYPRMRYWGEIAVTPLYMKSGVLLSSGLDSAI